MTPLLFEICSGSLDNRHCAFPIRATKAMIRKMDIGARHALDSNGE